MFTYDVDEDEPGHLINPYLDLSDEEQDGEEGCLSMPGLAFDCKRAMRVVAKGFDMYGEPVVIEGSDLLARCVQHETDHLDGILFIDRLDKATRKLAHDGDPRGRVVRRADAAGQGQPAPHLRHDRSRPRRAARLRRHARGRAARRWPRCSPPGTTSSRSSPARRRAPAAVARRGGLRRRRSWPRSRASRC